MPFRPILAGLLLCAATPLCAEPGGDRPGPARFEQRVVAIMSAGGTIDTIQGRLGRVAADPSLTQDQRLAIDAMRTLVRSKSRPNGVSLAEAEAFAARHPASPASALLIAEAALANDEAQRSADTLIGAAAKAGSLVQLVSPATVSKLTGELDDLSDRKRVAELAKALLYSGWNRGSASLRSFLAIEAIRDEVAAGRIDRARRLLPVVKSPASLHLIMIDERLAPLRSDVVQLAGSKLERAWQDFLAKSRDEWLGRGDALSAVAYVEALKQANLYEALVDAFLMRFMRGYNCAGDQVARSVGPDLANSLARIGRWSRAEDLMRRSGGISPAIYAAMLLERGEFGRASSLLERSPRAADPPKDRGDRKAIAWLQAANDCAAFHLRGSTPGSGADLALLDVSERLFVLLCTDRTAEAESTLLAALVDELERDDALRWLQPFSDLPIQSDFRKEMNNRIRALQRNPAIVSATARYGAILDWPLTSAVPNPLSLTPAKMRTSWQCGDQTDWETGPAAPESVYLPDASP